VDVADGLVTEDHLGLGAESSATEETADVLLAAG